MAKLSPGERAVNWAKALSVVCAALISLLGYTNRDAISGFIFAGDNAITTLTPFEQYMREEIERIDSEEAEGRAMVLNQMGKADKSIASRLNSQNKKIEKIRELVN